LRRLAKGRTAKQALLPRTLTVTVQSIEYYNRSKDAEFCKDKDDSQTAIDEAREQDDGDYEKCSVRRRECESMPCPRRLNLHVRHCCADVALWSGFTALYRLRHTRILTLRRFP
jgi:hypothetical protein